MKIPKQLLEQAGIINEERLLNVKIVIDKLITDECIIDYLKTFLGNKRPTKEMIYGVRQLIVGDLKYAAEINLDDADQIGKEFYKTIGK